MGKNLWEDWIREAKDGNGIVQPDGTVGIIGAGELKKDTQEEIDEFLSQFEKTTWDEIKGEIKKKKQQYIFMR